MTSDLLPLTLLGINTNPRGTVVHLFDVEGARTQTLCGRRIHTNPRHLYVGTWVDSVVSADLATCARCLRAAERLP